MAQLFVRCSDGLIVDVLPDGKDAGSMVVAPDFVVLDVAADVTALRARFLSSGRSYFDFATLSTPQRNTLRTDDRLTVSAASIVETQAQNQPLEFLPARDAEFTAFREWVESRGKGLPDAAAKRAAYVALRPTPQAATTARVRGN